MIKVIKTLCYLFNKKKDFMIDLSVYYGEIYPYKIKTKKEFCVYLYFDRLTGEPRMEYEDNDINYKTFLTTLLPSNKATTPLLKLIP